MIQDHIVKALYERTSPPEDTTVTVTTPRRSWGGDSERRGHFSTTQLDSKKWERTFLTATQRQAKLLLPVN